MGITRSTVLLVTALVAELYTVWPELKVVAVVGNGIAAVEQSLALKPMSNASDLDATLAQLRTLLTAPANPEEQLKVIQASVGNSIRMVPVAEVLVLEAADKYLRVLTAAAEYLIRTPLKELLTQLDPDAFWQVHRGTVVRANAIDSVQRDEAGRNSLRLRERPTERFTISQL